MFFVLLLSQEINDEKFLDFLSILAHVHIEKKHIALIVCIKWSPMRTILCSISYTIVLLHFLTIATFALFGILRMKMLKTNRIISY